MRQKWMALVAVLAISPIMAHGAKVVLEGAVTTATGLYENGGRWRSDASSNIHFLALNYMYDGTNITLISATSFDKFTDGGEKKYTKRVYTPKEVRLVTVKGVKAGFSIHLEDEDASEFNVFQGVLSGSMSQGVVTSLAGAATFLSWDKPDGILGDMYDVRYSLQKSATLRTAAEVEARLRAQGYTLQADE